MKGKYRIIVTAKRLRYDFEIRRNITIIRGDSATGKTTLVDMIQEYVNNPSGTPVEVSCLFYNRNGESSRPKTEKVPE